MIERMAPQILSVLDYDRHNLLTYAELLDADAAGISWKVGALSILGIDPGIDPQVDGDAARHCWDSHLSRARWITCEGLADAVEAWSFLRCNHSADPVDR